MKTLIPTPITDHLSTIRIAPVCNGKIYVTPRPTEDGTSTCLDLPIEETLAHFSPKSNKGICKVTERYSRHLHTDIVPRFSVKYRPAPDDRATVYLYILPLKQEDEISFHDGKFISAEEIGTPKEAYSPRLNKESELLAMAAKLWNEYPVS